MLLRTIVAISLVSFGILIIACGGGGERPTSQERLPAEVPPVPPATTHSTATEANTIPGLHAVDVHGNFTSKGFTLTKDLHPDQSVWRCIEETASYMMIVEAFGQPTELTLVRGTYSNLSNNDTDAAAKEFLGYVASLPYDGSDPVRARAWVEQNVGTNVTTTIGDVSFELIRSNPRVRMLLIEPAAVAVQRSPSTNPSSGSESTSPPEDRMTAEQRAASKLRLAKQLLEKQPDSGRKWLQDVIKDYPDTEAANEAQKILDDL